MTEDEVLQILDLIEKSNFDFLELQMGDLKLTVSKGGTPVRSEGGQPIVHVSDSSSGQSPAVRTEAPKEAAPAAPQPQTKPVPVKEGTVPITAPMVGTFYATPEPGAAPFVEVGDHVDAETTVGLVEVMKVFNAVSSGTNGIIEEICVESGQFVEHGQTLFLVRPDA